MREKKADRVIRCEKELDAAKEKLEREIAIISLKR
jgi:hypothetical protein